MNPSFDFAYALDSTEPPPNTVRHWFHHFATILTLLEGRALDGMIMVELDGGRNMPMSALETATIAKSYLEKQGVPFRT